MVVPMTLRLSGHP